MNNKVSLEIIKDLSIDQIIKLYHYGYVLEDSKITHLQYLPPSILFHVTCSSTNCEDAHIIVNNTDQGITDYTGTFMLAGLSVETTIKFTVSKLGYNDFTDSIVTGGYGDVKDAYIGLTPATEKATLKFVVTEPGTSHQLPSYGAHVILDNKEAGQTDKFGILIVPDLAANSSIPFLVNKAGFPESFGIAKVGDAKDSPTDINVNLQLFPIRTLTILRTALIGSIFLTSIGVIGNYLISRVHIKEEIEKAKN